jgi:hypothetical protein
VGVSVRVSESVIKSESRVRVHVSKCESGCGSESA